MGMLPIQHNSSRVRWMLCNIIICDIMTNGWHRTHMATLYMSVRVMIMVLNNHTLVKGSWKRAKKIDILASTCSMVRDREGTQLWCSSRASPYPTDCVFVSSGCYKITTRLSTTLVMSHILKNSYIWDKIYPFTRWLHRDWTSWLLTLVQILSITDVNITLSYGLDITGDLCFSPQLWIIHS